MDELTELLGKYKKEPQGTETAPQGTATAPQGTATAPEGTATAPEGTATPLGDNNTAFSGGQADLVIQKGKVLKVYKPGNGFNANVLPLVKTLKGRGFVVDLYDFGTMDYKGERRQFELMEYCPLGAVSAINLKGNKDIILEIAMKVAEALDACHKTGFIHKDVKPANILIRDQVSWNCVLCDFGIADVLDHGKVSTLQSRTPIYAAPEVYEHTVNIGNKTYCELTPAADFYSLGMTILCLWYGESAFRNKEATLALQKVNQGIVVPTDMPDPLYTITRGLLIKDPSHRWGLKEIKATLAGKKVDIYDEHRQGGMNIIFNSSKNQIAHSVEELAAFMVDDLNLSIKYLYSGKISKWLEHIPELQIEIENIVEKDFPKDQQTGVLAAIHTLNPFYDLRLCCDLKDPDYAMTGEALGRALNQSYHHYFTLEDAGLLDTHIAESFCDSDNSSYTPWFLDHKGKRFTQQRKWFDYCVFKDSSNSKKAGPKDSNYLHQVAMMKTIAGFGATPEYRLSKTGETLTSLSDVYRVSKKELRDDLRNDRGLRGWIAVMCQENPHADLSKKYSYEKLLEQYVKTIGYIDSEDPVFERFIQARVEAKDIIDNAKTSIRGTWTASLIQKLMAIFLSFIPLAILLTRIILNIIDNPIVNISGSWGSYLFYGLGILAAVIAFFTLDSDGCLIPIIIGAVIAFVGTLLVGLIGKIILYLFAIVTFVALVLFGIGNLFGFSKNRTKVNSITNPGFEELTLEPLYYAFSKEKSFDSSLNGAVNNQSVSLWKEDVRKRWSLLLISIGSTAVLWLCSLLLPESARMEQFDQHFKQNNPTEIIQDDTM